MKQTSVEVDREARLKFRCGVGIASRSSMLAVPSSSP